MSPRRSYCSACSAVLPPDGRCIECVTTLPWMRKCWKVRRKEILSDKPNCHWCLVAFDATHPASIHHVKGYKLKSGKRDWFAYMSLIDEDVVAICKQCHFSWTKSGIRRVPARPCIDCKAPTSAPSGACSRCARARWGRSWGYEEWEDEEERDRKRECKRRREEGHKERERVRIEKKKKILMALATGRIEFPDLLSPDMAYERDQEKALARALIEDRKETGL